MKIEIIKPKYTIDDINKMYYGSDPNMRDDISNPKVKELHEMMIVIILLYFIILLLSSLTGWVNFYFKSIIYFMHGPTNLYDLIINKLFSGHILYTGLLCFLLLFLPVIVPVFMMYKFWKSKRNKLIKNKKIYISAIFSEKYYSLILLYEEAEKIMPYLKDDNIKSILIKDKDTICICLRNQLIQKEIEFTFKEMANEIFKYEKGNIVDFSVLDEKII